MAVDAAISRGIHVCVAAGNAGDDACQSSPASAGGASGHAITVGAVDINDRRASFSNYGDCVDVYAPGVGIVSSWIGQTNMVNSLSGTSMAAPHVTGEINVLLMDNLKKMLTHILFSRYHRICYGERDTRQRPGAHEGMAPRICSAIERRDVAGE